MLRQEKVRDRKNDFVCHCLYGLWLIRPGNERDSGGEITRCLPRCGTRHLHRFPRFGQASALSLSPFHTLAMSSPSELLAQAAALATGQPAQAEELYKKVLNETSKGCVMFPRGTCQSDDS